MSYATAEAAYLNAHTHPAGLRAALKAALPAGTDKDHLAAALKVAIAAYPKRLLDGTPRGTTAHRLALVAVVSYALAADDDEN